MQWHTMGEVLRRVDEVCSDGRGTMRAVCNLGGKSGSFINQMSSVEEEEGHDYTEAEVETNLLRYLEHFHGDIHLHTSDHAMQDLATHLNVSKPQMYLLIHNPGARMEEVLDALTDPRFVGCGHLRGMLAMPENYEGIRPGLVRSFIRVFFKLHWSGRRGIQNRMRLSTMIGDHAEHATFTVESTVPDADIDSSTLTPTLQPKVQFEQDHRVQELQAFIAHTGVARQEDKWFASVAPIVTGIRNINQALLAQIERRRRDGTTHATLDALASHLPIIPLEADPQARTLRRKR